MTVRVDGREKQFKHFAGKSVEELTVRLASDEHIQRIDVGADDQSIKALSVSTTERVLKFGSLASAERVETLSLAQEHRAVIGFHMLFNDRIVVEFTAVTAPLLKDLNRPEVVVRSTKSVRPRKNTILNFKKSIEANNRSF